MKRRLYIETTIISYLTARTSRNPIVAGRQALTREWWEHRRTAFDLVVSELVFEESTAGDEEAAKRRLDYISGIDSLHISDEAVMLAEALVSEGPIPKDPIVEDVRDARQKHAARFNYDLRKIAEDLRMKEQKSGRMVVSFPPKPAKKKAVA